jgi:hypothetical protein
VTAASEGTIDFVTTTNIRKMLTGNESMSPYDLVTVADVVSF